MADIRLDTAPDVAETSLDLSDLELGRTIREMVAAKFDADTARKFCEALVIPTRPGISERATQDRVFGTIMARIDRLVTGAAT